MENNGVGDHLRAPCRQLIQSYAPTPPHCTNSRPLPLSRVVIIRGVCYYDLLRVGRRDSRAPVSSSWRSLRGCWSCYVHARHQSPWSDEWALHKPQEMVWMRVKRVIVSRDHKNRRGPWRLIGYEGEDEWRFLLRCVRCGNLFEKTAARNRALVASIISRQ
jgi:hypothetical protein